MESSDLSLLEISEEDDSLLQQSPIDESSNLNNYLSCSPLVRSRYTPLVCMKTDENEAMASGLPPQNKINKENSGANNSEVPNLCNEPQQMKRRKKGGGYNLRKSIAWNKAFFTEEGFLDPSELSMISGTLCSIQEEGSGGNSNYFRGSSGLQSIEEYSLAKTPGSIRKKGNGGLFTSHCDSSPRDKGAPTSATPKKVLSVHDSNRSRGSPGGSSRILASSSNKRPPSGRITRAVAKESKLPKFPVLKPDAKSVSTATRSATNSNLVARRALNVQKDVGFKASSSSRRILDADIKRRPISRSLPAKASVPSFRKDTSNSTRQITLSKHAQPPNNSKSNKTPGLTQDPVLPAAVIHASNIHQSFTKSEITSQLVPGNEQSAQPQASKPSSLRMPSPSLGFFGQPKAPGTQILTDKGALLSKTRESGIPKVQKPASKLPDLKVKPPRAPAKAIKVIKVNNPVTSSVPSATKAVFQDNLKLKLDLQKVDNPPTVLNDTCDDAVKRSEVSQANVITENQQTGYKNYNSSAVDHVAIAEPQLQTINETTLNDQGVHGVNVITAYDDHGQSELTKSCFGEDNQISFERNQGTGTKDSFSLQESRPSEKIDLEEVSSKDLVVGKSDSRTCDDLPQYAGQEKESSELDCSSVKLSGESVQVESIDCNVLAGSCSRELSTFTVDDPQILVSSVNEITVEPSQPTNPCVNEKDLQVLHPSDFRGTEFKSVHIASQFAVDTQVGGDCGLNCSSDQLQREDTGQNLLVNSECVFSDSQFVDMNSSSCQDVLIPTCNGTPSVNKQYEDQSEFRKSRDLSTCEIIQVENPELQEGNVYVIVKDRSFEELQKHGTGNLADANPYVQDSVAGEVDISQPFSQHECIDQANREPAKIQEITDESHLLDAEIFSLDNQVVEDTSDLTNSLDHHDSPKCLDDSKQSAKNLESEFSCIIDESKEENIDIDGSEFVALKCGNAGETEVKSADLLSSIPPETNDAGIINVDINRRSSLVGDLPESQSPDEHHTFVTDSPMRSCFELYNQATLTAENLEELPKHITGNVADANPQVKADISTLFSEPECIDQVNKEPGTINEITDESHLVDAKESSLDNQFVEHHTGNLTNSLDHHESPKCLNDSKQSEKNIDFETSCIVDELKEGHIDVDVSAFVGILSLVPPETNDAGVINVVRGETLSLVGNLPESEPLVEDHSFVTNAPIRSSIVLNNEATLTAENFEQFHSVDEETELMIQTSSGKAQSDSNLIDDQEDQELQNHNDGLFKETRSAEEPQKFDTKDAGLSISVSTESEKESSRDLSQHKHMDQANEFVGDKPVELLDCNLITESFQYEQISTEVIGQQKGAIDDANQDCGQVSINSPELPCSSPTKHDAQLSLDQITSEHNSKSPLADGEIQMSDSANAEPTNMDDLVSAAKDKDETTTRSDFEKEKKDDVLVIKLSPNAVPFSDEWLAAMEAAGEDILAKKTGAVQHSPTEKAITEPGPWSPVKKKNHEIGPFDCTKFTNIEPSDSH